MDNLLEDRIIKLSLLRMQLVELMKDGTTEIKLKDLFDIIAYVLKESTRDA